MKTDIKELLPIGSVVRLKEAKKKLMIFGVKQMDSSEQKEYDYIGVIYPEGNLGTKFQVVFNHDSISEIVFRGYENLERDIFISNLSEYYEKKESAEAESTDQTQ